MSHQRRLSKAAQVMLWEIIASPFSIPIIGLTYNWRVRNTLQMFLFSFLLSVSQNYAYCLLFFNHMDTQAGSRLK